MLTGRGKEIQYLNQFYEKAGSRLIVVYGQKGVGKTRLVYEFIEDKPHCYYVCRECSEREQRFQWGRELLKQDGTQEPYDWQELFAAGLQKYPGKQVLVLDEFQYLVKNSADFMKELVSFVQERDILVILISSSPSWVENSMVKKIGEAAFSLSGLVKIRPLDFYQMRRAFPDFAIEDAIYLYAILGGVPGLWQYMSPEKSLKENICGALIDSTGALHDEGRRMLSEELRELNVYQTILSALAQGNHKLNDIYTYTGFSRAKISVYLKNLMELELIEKAFSYDTKGQENVQKGVYRISQPLIHFWFTYLYPNRSMLERKTPADFYTEYIYPALRKYTEPYFKGICRAYLLQEDTKDILPFPVSGFGEWIGKTGKIDIVMQGALGETLLCACNWEKPMFPYEDYEELLRISAYAKLEADHIWLFSGGRFDERLRLEEKTKGNIRLVSLREIGL